jgi:hypothetical protein
VIRVVAMIAAKGGERRFNHEAAEWFRQAIAKTEREAAEAARDEA